MKDECEINHISFLFCVDQILIFTIAKCCFVILLPLMQTFLACRNPAAGFTALASEHRVPIPDPRCAQQKPSGSKHPRKRSCKAGQNINKRCKDVPNDNKGWWSKEFGSGLPWETLQKHKGKDQVTFVTLVCSSWYRWPSCNPSELLLNMLALGTPVCTAVNLCSALFLTPWCAFKKKQ